MDPLAEGDRRALASPDRIIWIFFLQAVAGGGVFARIPDIQTNLALAESLLGAALAVGMAGGLAANLFAGRMVSAYGTRALLLWGVPLLAAMNAVIAIVPGPISLFLALVASGSMFSITNVAMNVEADRVERQTGQRTMNRCHGMWSFGMLLAAGIGVLARAVPIGAGMHLWAMVPVVILATVLLVFPMVSSADASQGRPKSGLIARPSLRTLLVVGFGLSAGVAQMGAQNWSVIFMRDTFAVAAWLDTISLPAFLLTMAVGRMVADPIISRVGPQPVAVALILLGATSCLMIAISPFAWLALLGFGLLGFGAAVQFPLMITAAARSSRRDPAEAVSAVIFTSGLVMTLTPGLMGVIADLWGLRFAFASLIAFFMLSLALVRPVVR